MDPFDISKFRKAATTTDDAAKKVERTRREEPEQKPPPSSGQTSDKRRDPDKPPGTEGYEDDVAPRPGGGAKDGTETQTPAAEVVEETVSVTSAPVDPNRALSEAQRQIAEGERRKKEALDRIRAMERERYLDTPEGRRELQAEALVESRQPNQGLVLAQELASIPAYLASGLTMPFGGPEFAGPGKTLREKARQSRGGFIQEVRPPEEPRLRSTGEIITPAMSIERLTTRIGERKEQKLDLQKEAYDRQKVERSLPRTSAPRLMAEAERKSIQSNMNQIQREIDALIKLRDEIQASAAGDAAE